MRVLIDGEAFARQGRSGITRYFTELVRELDADPALGVGAVTPYRYVANEHLAEMAPDRFRRVPLPPRLRPRALALANSAARRRAAAPVDLVHHTLYLPQALDAGPDVPRVCTVYDFTLEMYADLFPASWLPLLEEKQQFLERCDGLLCISQTTYDDLKRVHPGLDKPIEVTPLGVSARFFEPRRGPLPGIPERYLLYVGNRHANKNVDVLLKAFAAVSDRAPDLHLVLCGNRLTDEERARLETLGIARRTVCLRVSDEDLPTLYAHAQAFVFPSRYEGFGLPVAEALASGCPALVSDVPALVEVGGGAAMTFDPDDPDALAALVERVLGDEALRTRMIATGIRRARELSWRQTAMTTAAAYRRILEA